MRYFNQAQSKRATGLSYLGSINSSAKISKNKKVNNYTYVLYLAPASASGYNVCPHSTPECRLGCLATSGRVKIETYAGMNTIQAARAKKTRLLFEEQEFFMRWLVAELQSGVEKAARDGYAFSARLNGTSDIEWENYKLDGKTVFQLFPDVQFYDYTKNAGRMLKPIAPNYHLTFSYSGRNEEVSKKVLAKGQNVAVVFDTADFPETWNGYPVINGDLTDYRPLDGEGVVVGLKWKKIANKENDQKIRNSCFVVKTNVLAEVSL